MSLTTALKNLTHSDYVDIHRFLLLTLKIKLIIKIDKTRIIQYKNKQK